MSKIPAITPIIDLRQDASAIVKKAFDTREPVFITQRGRPTAVLVSMDLYERTQHELEILKLLALGEQRIESGKGHELDTVLAKAEKAL